MNPEVEKLLAGLNKSEKAAILDYIRKQRATKGLREGAEEGIRAVVQNLTEDVSEGAKAGVRAMYENGGKIGGEPDVNEMLDALSKDKQGKVARLQNRDTRQFNREQNQQFRESMKTYNELYDTGPESWTPEQADFIDRMDTYLEAIYGEGDANKSRMESTDNQISGKDVFKAGAAIAPIAAGFSMAPLFQRAKMRKDDPNRWRQYSQTSPVHDMGLFEKLFPKFSGVEQ